MPDPVDIIHCEVCELPHRRGVAVCEECSHLLGTAPNWGQLRADVAVERNKALVLSAATLFAGVTMITLVGRVSLAIVVGSWCGRSTTPAAGARSRNASRSRPARSCAG